MLGVVFAEPGQYLFQLLTADGANLSQFLETGGLADVKLEVGVDGQVLHLRLGQVGAEDRRESLALADPIAKLHLDPRDPPFDKGHDRGLTVAVGLDNSARSQCRLASAALKRGDLQSGAFDHLRRNGQVGRFTGGNRWSRDPWHRTPGGCT